MDRIVMVANDTNCIWHLRRELLQRLINEGYSVTIICDIMDFRENLESIGCDVVGVKTSRRGTNPVKDIHLFFKYLRILQTIKPTVVLTNNIKPNIYAGMACRMLNLKYMPNICGLGTPLENPGKIQKLAIFLYKIGIRGAKTVFFQNDDNKQFFKEHGMTPPNAKTIVTPGSGVNLETHPLLPWPEGTIHFLYAARIMKQKGIDLFLAAARKYSSNDVVFDVCGQCDDKQYEEVLLNEKKVCYHGLQNDLTPFYERCSCFLYPSYYPEGVSNVLLEAAACGRPVIATNRPGCRETVEDGVSGFLIPANDEQAVLKSVDDFLRLDTYQQENMGKAGRAKVEKGFDRRFVVESFIKEIITV